MLENNKQVIVDLDNVRIFGGRGLIVANREYQQIVQEIVQKGSSLNTIFSMMEKGRSQANNIYPSKDIPIKKE